jgi:hypothetical protein
VSFAVDTQALLDFLSPTPIEEGADLSQINAHERISAIQKQLSTQSSVRA